VNAALVTARFVLTWAMAALPPAAPAATDEGIGEGVVARGLATINTNVGAARQAAVDQALAHAVRCRRGVSLTATRRTANHRLTESTVQTSTRGAVRTYEMLKESRRPKTYDVRLRALFEEDLELRRRARRAFKRTRLVIRPAAGLPSRRDRAIFNIVLSHRLREEGFTLLLQPDTENDMPDADTRTPPTSRRLETGDLILLVQATLDRAEPLGRLEAEQCTVTAKIVRSPEGEIVASTRISTMGDRDVHASQARKSVLKRAAQDLADRIVAQLRRHLTEEPAETSARKHRPRQVQRPAGATR